MRFLVFARISLGFAVAAFILAIALCPLYLFGGGDESFALASSPTRRNSGLAASSEERVVDICRGMLHSNMASSSAYDSSAVLFSFDRVSWPLKDHLDLELEGRETPCGRTRVALSRGELGMPDSGRVIFYGSVVKDSRAADDGKQHRLLMFYVGLPAVPPGTSLGGGRVCIAQSSDGETWHKPRLDSAGSNVVLPGETDVGSVLVIEDEEDEDIRQRFKMILKVRPYKLHSAFSADGISWPRISRPLSGLDGVDPSGLARWQGAYILAAHRDRSYGRRKLHAFISYDFVSWTEASGLWTRSAESAPGAQDNNAGEQVHLGASLWPRWPSLLGVYGQWHGHPSNDRSLVSIDLGLVVSSDGLNFEEPLPSFRLVAAAEDGCDASWSSEYPSLVPAIVQGQAFANLGNRTFFWYGAWPEQRSTGVRLAVWPRDRLGALKCLKCGSCHAISARMNAAASNLEVHVNVAGVMPGSSFLIVEVLDSKLQPIKGLSGADAAVVDKEGLAVAASFPPHVLQSDFRLRVGFAGVLCGSARLFAVYVASSACDRSAH